MVHFDTPLIDCDIHPHATDAMPLPPHLPEAFRQAVAQGQASQPSHGYQNPFGVNRRDVPGCDPLLWAKDLLDKYDIAFGVLQPPGLTASLTHNIDVGSAVAHAWNSWQVENFLAADSRYLGSICVNMNDPLAAVQEIRRAAKNARMVQVLACGQSALLYGHRMYHPIYEVCNELGLPFTLHPGQEGSLRPSTPVGAPSSYFEWRASIPLTYMAHTASLLCEGVFEKYPNLKLLLVEGGFGWLPHLMWRLDKDYKALRSTTPWLKRLPSESILEQVRLTSQPMEEPARPAHLLQMLDMIEAGRTLCFASDYPHWDFDNPRRAFPPRLDPDMRNAIFYDNAAALYGLPARVAAQPDHNLQEVAV